MKLAGFDDESIRKMGRWLPSSNAFLGYIQQQLLGFSQGMTTKTSRIARFTNTEGSENHTGQEFNTVYGGRHYHNSFLHLGGNWAQHKDRVAVPFLFAFLLFPKHIPLHCAHQNQVHCMVSWFSTASPSQCHLGIHWCLARVSPMYHIEWGAPQHTSQVGCICSA